MIKISWLVEKDINGWKLPYALDGNASRDTI